jgi:hypothetical protein
VWLWGWVLVSVAGVPYPTSPTTGGT